jgi:hypothetical protein
MQNKSFREVLDFYKDNPKKLVEQLESCQYECIGGYLTSNVAFAALRELISEDRIKPK